MLRGDTQFRAGNPASKSKNGGFIGTYGYMTWEKYMNIRYGLDRSFSF